MQPESKEHSATFASRLWSMRVAVKARLQLKHALSARGIDIQRQPTCYGSDLYHALYPEESIRQRRFYNIGAGAFHHPFWTNVDHLSNWYGATLRNNLDIDHDLLSLRPLPIPDNSAEVAYTSHTVEHITEEAAAALFRESYRILKPGGFFRVTTPNIDLDYEAYLKNDRSYYYWIAAYSVPAQYRSAACNKPFNLASIQQLFLVHFAASASELHIDGASRRISDSELDNLFSTLPYEQALNYCLSQCPPELQRKYPGNHINWWNPGKMTAALRTAGFSRVYTSGYGQSFCPVLRNTLLFDSTHPKISLYVEAVK